MDRIPTPVTNPQMEKMIRELFESLMKPFVAKNAEYAGIDKADTQEDSLSNFWEVAADVGITPEQVWHVYFEKHRRVVTKFIRTGTFRIPPYKAIRDVIGYAYILYVMGVALGYWTHEEAVGDLDAD
jgi:hypothetical protein